VIEDYYKNIQVLAQGGMSTIYLATDRELNRQVVLKVMKLAGDTTERAISEAKLIASFNHPNIVQLYKIIHRDQQVLLEMEYVKGNTLAHVMKEQRLTLTEKLEILIHISDGLAAIHDKGILHLDLKPANVLVSDEGTVKITDFGISKIKGVEATDIVNDYGSLNAMSPEQLNNQAVDFRSDLFSLGLIAYQLLTGYHAYSKQASSSTAQDLAKQIKSFPCCANYKPIKELSADLVPLLKQLLAFKVDKRPESARAVASQFRDVLASLSFESVTVDVTSYKNNNNLSKTFFNRRLLLVVILFLLLSGGSWFWYASKPIERIALLPVEFIANSQVTDAQKRLLSLGVKDAITEYVLADRKLALIASREVKQAQLILGKEAGLNDLAAALGATKLLIPLLDCNRLSCDFTLNELDKNATMIGTTRSATDKENYLNIYNSTLSSIQSLLTPSILSNRELLLSDEFIRQYVSLVALTANDLGSSQKQRAMAESLLLQEPDFKPLYPLYRKIVLRLYKSSKNVELITKLQFQLERSPTSYRESPAYLVDLLEIYQYTGEHLKAEKIISRIQSSSLEEYQREIILAIYFKRTGRLEESLKHAKMAYKIRPTLLATRNLAIAYLTLGKRADALKYLKEVLSYNPDDVVTLKTVADVSLLSGDLTAAEDNYQKLIDSGQQSASIYSNYSIVLSLQGELVNALNLAEKAMMLDTKTTTLQLNYADLLYLQGRFTEAESLYLKISDQLGSSSKNVADQLEKAQVLIHLNRNQQAMNQVEQLLAAQPNLAEAYFIKAMLQSLLNEKYSALASVEQSINLGWSPVFYRLPWFKGLCSESKLMSLIGKEHYYFLCSVKNNAE